MSDSTVALSSEIVRMPAFVFGDCDYAQIYSRVSMVASISNAAAAFIWGTVIDATHSYMPMFIGVIVLMAATVVTVVVISRMQAQPSGDPISFGVSDIRA